MFATAEGLLTQQDHMTKDGLQEVFATNLFGHFLMVNLSVNHNNLVPYGLTTAISDVWVAIEMETTAGYKVITGKGFFIMNNYNCKQTIK